MKKRTQGKITHWNEQKGYGFITPAAGAKQVFVHIRAFSNRQERPKLNQLVSFSLSTDEQGRPCAMDVTQKGERPAKGSKRNDNKNNSRGGNLRTLITILLVAYASWFGYSRLIAPQMQGGISPKASTNYRIGLPITKALKIGDASRFG